MKRNLFVVFMAAAISMFFVNALQEHFNPSYKTLIVIAVFSYLIPGLAVLKVQPWRPELVSPRRLVLSLLFVLGAVAFNLLFNHYWMEWARAFDPSGDILGKVSVDSTPSDNPLMENILTWVIAPVGEEIIVRLGMLGIFIRLMPKGLALLLSSALFAFGHIYVYSSVQLVTAFAFGVLAGVIYLEAGLGFSILFHAIINFWPYIKENFFQNVPFVLTLSSFFLLGLIVFLIRLVQHRKEVFGTNLFTRSY